MEHDKVSMLAHNAGLLFQRSVLQRGGFFHPQMTDSLHAESDHLPSVHRREEDCGSREAYRKE